jgi:UDP-N-acetylglucosamine--N-acetylmuramyl-(pentapeptide) pyrophosphoryl-undecaprenol N-acetylglucosamine transferase
LSLARELKKQSPNCQIVYIGHKGDQFDNLQVSSSDFDFMAFVNGGKFRRYHNESFWRRVFDIKTFLLNVRDFFRVIKSIGTAWRILSKTKPDVLFSKGGFVSVPVGIAARLKRIPIITHDSDTIGGLANRIVGRWARLHATGMPAKFYPYPKDTIRYVGIPLDENIKQVSEKYQLSVKQQLGLPPRSQVILLAGGGNGSKRLNDLMVESAPLLLSNNLALNIVHITGASHEAEVKKQYQHKLDKGELNRVLVMGFTPEFYRYSAAADLIISRAGATAIAEFAEAAKACIIIPSPFLTSGHQLKNAQELESDGAAVVFPEEGSAQELTSITKELLQDDNKRKSLAKHLHEKAKPGAAKELARIVLEMAR